MRIAATMWSMSLASWASLYEVRVRRLALFRASLMQLGAKDRAVRRPNGLAAAAGAGFRNVSCREVHTTLEAAPDGIMAVGAERQVTFVNQAFLALLDAPSDHEPCPAANRGGRLP